ncbi:uncharacterized protein [Rutidosis leptorrhynchoides]|uniref:uncharacterized protein n=1 Tax=Rutidosis leptorrhynchoides TaxID=125765 RepID=UPI003A9A5A73
MGGYRFCFGLPREIVSDNGTQFAHNPFKDWCADMDSLVYGTEAVILAEILVPTKRITTFDGQQNDETLRENLDALEERRTIAHIRQAEKKKKNENHYDKKVKPLDFQLHDLVLRSKEASRQQDVGKLGPRWEGPYRVVGITDYGAYYLETPDGIPVQ